MPVYLILLDAFRHDYLSPEHTPFLAKCAGEGEYYEKVRPSPGFCERAEILTGLSAKETGFFAAIGFDPDHSEYRHAVAQTLADRAERAALWPLQWLPANLRGPIHRRVRGRLARHLVRRDRKMKTYFIPHRWLPYFALTEDRVDHRERGAFPRPSLLSLLEDAGGTYYYDSFSALGFRAPYSSDSERLQAVLKDLRANPKDLYLIYQTAPDAAGHRYGPDSAGLHAALRVLDNDIARFVAEAESVRPSGRYVFLGDHGMTAVDRKFDAEGEISRLLSSVGLSRHRDVVYFLDSTLVRLWAMSARARAALPMLLEASSAFAQHGGWAHAHESLRAAIPWPDRRYGDFLWAADPGVIVTPDFFQGTVAPKGMHGYVKQTSDALGMCIRWRHDGAPVRHDQIDLSGAYNLLRDELDL